MENQIEIISDVYQTGNDIQQTIELVSVRKFMILSLITFGLYDLWWNYRAWQFIERYKKPGISPAFRTVFGIFYLYSLFRQILNMAKEKGYHSTYSTPVLFIFILLLEIISAFSPYLILLSVIEIFLFIPPFKALNYIIRHMAYVTVVEQESFNTRQIILLVLGIIAWICFPFIFIVN
ncbi:MAG: hypothetical protein IPP15_13780 [Saprospiraceae bacterium]|uniref:DUF4234 domain-containing protein n=1 Tax=Candidatus Opimibacter skivensis TaxID=2982028 RepID=A0A9D7SUI5_9BACT|nr:hypothetical protein [Candidatus Opimibacter skivensis]